MTTPQALNSRANRKKPSILRPLIFVLLLVLVIAVQYYHPERYLADVSRRRRWARGDWQIARWLLPRVPGPGNTRRPNPLDLLELSGRPNHEQHFIGHGKRGGCGRDIEPRDFALRIVGGHEVVDPHELRIDPILEPRLSMHGCATVNHFYRVRGSHGLTGYDRLVPVPERTARTGDQQRKKRQYRRCKRRVFRPHRFRGISFPSHGGRKRKTSLTSRRRNGLSS